MKNNPAYHVRVTADQNPIALNLREVWKYRDLIMLLTKRSFTLIYKQTILGPAWVVLTPFLTSIVYTVVFGNMAGLSTAGVPKLLFYLSSHSLWSFFAECVTRNSSTFITNANVFGKVYFPRLTVPISSVLFAGIQFLVQLVMVIALIVFHVFQGAVHPRPELIPLLVPVILITGLIGLSMGILISSVTTKYRDLQLLVSFGIHLFMYVSPVIFPVSQLSDGIWKTLLLLNPMTAPMELFRTVLLGTGTVRPVSILSTGIFAVIIIPLSVLIFNRVERNFIDTV